MFAVPLKEIPERGFYQTLDAKDGLYYAEPYAKKLWTGEKTMIVKKDRLKEHEHVGTYILGEYAYGVLELLEPELLDPQEVKTKFRKEHLISNEGWEKLRLPKEEKVYVYRPHVLRSFRHPYDYHFPLGTKDVVEKVRLFKSIARLTHPSGKGEDLEPIKESYLDNLDVLLQKRAHPETPIEEIAKRPFSTWIIHQHLVGEYGKKGERGLKRENLVGLPIKKGKAHWDFRFQIYNPKTNKLLDRLEWLEEVVEGEARLGWTQTSPPSNEKGYEKKILVVPKAVQPKDWLFVKGKVPIGEPGSGVNLPGYFHILERTMGIKGDHEPNFREYFLFGNRWNGRFVVRRVRLPKMRWGEDEKPIELKKQVYRWLFWKTNDQARMATLLEALRRRGRKIPNVSSLRRLYPLEKEKKESVDYAWSMPLESLRMTKEGVVIEGEAIHVGKTRNRDIFTEWELMTAAKSLINKPLELDHDLSDRGPVLSAAWDKDKWSVVYQALITDKETIDDVLHGRLLPHVSVRAGWKESPWVDGYLLKGVWFKRLSLLKKTLPADPKATMRATAHLLKSIAFKPGRESLYDRFFYCAKCSMPIPKRASKFGASNRVFCPVCSTPLRTKKRNRKKREYDA